MARIEVLDEEFFPIPALKVDGLIVTAPKAAVDKYEQLRDGWLKDHPKLSKEEPTVSLAPGKLNNQPEYFVRTEVMYRG